MNETDHCIRLPGLVMRPATDADADAVEKHIFTILRAYGLRPDPAGVDRDLRHIEEAFWRLGGAFWVAESDNGQIVATVAMKPDGAVVELQKMYFSPVIRGRGLGKKLLEWLLDWAREQGYRSVVLDTASVLEEAIALYEKAGFQLVCEDSKVPRCDRTYHIDLKDTDHDE